MPLVSVVSIDPEMSNTISMAIASAVVWLVDEVECGFDRATIMRAIASRYAKGSMRASRIRQVNFVFGRHITEPKIISPEERLRSSRNAGIISVSSSSR